MRIMISQIDSAMRVLCRRESDSINIAEAKELDVSYVRAGSLPVEQDIIRLVSIRRDLDGNDYLDIPESHLNGDKQ